MPMGIANQITHNDNLCKYEFFFNIINVRFSSINIRKGKNIFTPIKRSAIWCMLILYANKDSINHRWTRPHGCYWSLACSAYGPHSPYHIQVVGSEGANVSHFWRAKNLGKILIILKNALRNLNIMLLGGH